MTNLIKLSQSTYSLLVICIVLLVSSFFLLPTTSTPTPNDQTTLIIPQTLTPQADKPVLEGLIYTPQVGPAELTYHTYFHGVFTCGVSGCTNEMTMSFDAHASKDKQVPEAAMLIIYFYRDGTEVDPFLPAHNSVFKLENQKLNTKRPFSAAEPIYVPENVKMKFYGELVYIKSASSNLVTLDDLTFTFTFHQKPSASKWKQSLSLTKPLPFFNQTTNGERHGVYIDAFRLIDTVYPSPDQFIIQIRLSQVKRSFSRFTMDFIGDVKLNNFSIPGVKKIKCGTDYGQEFTLEYLNEKSFEARIDIKQNISITLSCPELRLIPQSKHVRGIYASFRTDGGDSLSPPMKFGSIVNVVLTAQNIQRVQYGQLDAAHPVVFLEPPGYQVTPSSMPNTYLSSVYCQFEVDMSLSKLPLTQDDIRLNKEKFKIFIINAQPLSHAFATVIEGFSSIIKARYRVKEPTRGLDIDPFLFYEPFQASNDITYALSGSYYINSFVPLANSTDIEQAKSIQCQLWYESSSLDVNIPTPTPTPTPQDTQQEGEGMGSLYTQDNSNQEPRVILKLLQTVQSSLTPQHQGYKPSTGSNPKTNQTTNSFQNLSQDEFEIPFNPQVNSEEDSTDFKQFVFDYFSQQNGQHEQISQKGNTNYSNNNDLDQTHPPDFTEEYSPMFPAALPQPTRRTTYSVTSQIDMKDFMSKSDGLLFRISHRMNNTWRWPLYGPFTPKPSTKENSKSDSMLIQAEVENELGDVGQSADFFQSLQLFTLHDSLSSYFEQIDIFSTLLQVAIIDVWEHIFGQNGSAHGSTSQAQTSPNPPQTPFYSPRVKSLGKYIVYIDDLNGTYGIKESEFLDQNGKNVQNKKEEDTVFTTLDYAPTKPRHDTIPYIFYLQPVFPADKARAPQFFQTNFNLPMFEKQVRDLYIYFSLNAYTFEHKNALSATCIVDGRIEIGFIKLDAGFHETTRSDFSVLYFPRADIFSNDTPWHSLSCPSVVIKTQIRENTLPKEESDYWFPDDANRLVMAGFTNDDLHKALHKYAQQIPFKHFRIVEWPIATVVLITTSIILGVCLIVVIILRCCCCRQSRRGVVMRRKRKQQRKQKQQSGIDIFGWSQSNTDPHNPNEDGTENGENADRYANDGGNNRANNPYDDDDDDDEDFFIKLDGNHHSDVPFTNLNHQPNW
jgi:hypothetical protein